LAFLLLEGPEAWGFNKGAFEVKLFGEVMSIGILKLEPGEEALEGQGFY